MRRCCHLRHRLLRPHLGSPMCRSRCGGGRKASGGLRSAMERCELNHLGPIAVRPSFGQSCSRLWVRWTPETSRGCQGNFASTPSSWTTRSRSRGRVGAASLAADRAAPASGIRCALLNPNGLFSSVGELSLQWQPFQQALADGGYEALLLTLTEPHLGPGCNLPAGGSVWLAAAPPLSCRLGRRDAAIAVRSDQDSWRARPSARNDIVCIASASHHAPTVLVAAAYTPDSSRGPAARAAFFDALDAPLERWRAAAPNALVVLGMDSNTWDPLLDPSRRASPDLARVRTLLVRRRLTVVNQCSVATHRSGTVIDWLATSAPLQIRDFRVHGPSCDGHCALHPACHPALGSDHSLITFVIEASVWRAAPSLGVRLLRCDWPSALQAQAEGLAWLSELVMASTSSTTVGTRQAALDILALAIVDFLWLAADHHGAVRDGPPAGARRGCRWWTAECEIAWRRRQLAHRELRASPCAEASEHYRRERNRFAHIVARAQQQGWDTLLRESADQLNFNPRLVERVVRNEVRQGARGPPASMQRDGRFLDEGATVGAWAAHFAGQSPEPPHDPCWAADIEALVARWSREHALGLSQATAVSAVELREAAASLAMNARTAPGVDGIPYAPYLVPWPPWEEVMCKLFTQCLRWGLVPHLWRLGVVVPLAKNGDPSSFDNWRPITLLSCMGKVYEMILLRRMLPQIAVTLAPTQAGFRLGADEQAFALVEGLRMAVRQRLGDGHPLVTFLDIRKAFDSVWRAGLLFKLREKGVHAAEWAATAALLGTSGAHVRLPMGRSPSWQSEAGVRQGSILSPLLFLVYIDDLAHELLARAPGGQLHAAALLGSLLYVDDIALIASSAASLQGALDITATWAARWRLAFGRGPSKSAVMRLTRGRQSATTPLLLGGEAMPWVDEYVHLGVRVDRGLNLRAHVRERGLKAQGAFFACCGWVQRERLPIAVAKRLFDVHVTPVALWGAELVAFSECRMRELDQWQRKLGRWLLRDHRAPSGVVLGDLGWRPWSSLALERAISLWCRLPRGSAYPSSEVAAVSGSDTLGWSRTTSLALGYLEAPPPPGDLARLDSAARRRYVQRVVRPLLDARDAARWRQAMQRYQDPSLQRYAELVREPTLALPHAAGAPPHHASAWCRLRHGGSNLPTHHAGRHGASVACTLCSCAEGSTEHAILVCPALAAQREVWWQQVRRWAPWAMPSCASAEEVTRWFFLPEGCPADVVVFNAAFAYRIECAFGSDPN